jgi:hypothetical protein
VFFAFFRGSSEGFEVCGVEHESMESFLDEVDLVVGIAQSVRTVDVEEVVFRVGRVRSFASWMSHIELRSVESRDGSWEGSIRVTASPFLDNVQLVQFNIRKAPF